MGSHIVTCYPTQVNTPRCDPSQRLLLDLSTPEGWKAELSYVTSYTPKWFTWHYPPTDGHPSK